METKPCIICGSELECAVQNWSTLQPYKGGQATFNFCYGSCKFDLNVYDTEFTGIICDDCAERCIERMTLTQRKT